ncbi:hypothetical protein IFM89_009463 [Coptis chinensis]|uniref:PB1 domain-containing protein n=1 Tax=Coptis chinensis TaxID=261450 RepID=A0A835IBA9_9MAGN|nr:hypothetical protein IFM89_009463 [Coptis chinensis]
MKKEPSHFRYRKPPPSSSSSSLQPKKVKLCCSYTGTFQPKPLSGKLRYIGGETRIVSIDRNISFMQLVYRISQLCPTILTTCFCIKYQLPESNNEDDTPLVSITTDEDVKCMIEEYDHGNHATRLWVFVCTKATSAANADDDKNWYVRPLQDSCYMNICDLGMGNSCLESKIANAHIVGIPNCEDLQRKVVFKNQELVNNAVRYGKFHDLISLEAIEAKTMFINEYGIKNSCSPLKESSYIPQIQTSEVESYGFEASELRRMYTSDNVAQNSYSPFEESANLSHMKTSRMNGDWSLVNLYGQNMSDYNAPISHFPESQGGVVPFNNGGELGVGANFPVRLTNEIVKEGLVHYEDGGNAGISNQSLAAMQLANKVNNISVGSMSRGSNVNPGWRNTEGVHTGHSNNISLMYSTALCDSVQRSPDFDSCVSKLAGRVSPMKPAVCGNRALSNLHLRLRNHRTVGTE